MCVYLLVKSVLVLVVDLKLNKDIKTKPSYFNENSGNFIYLNDYDAEAGCCIVLKLKMRFPCEIQIGLPNIYNSSISLY